MTSLEKDFEFCEEIIKKHSKSFYKAFSTLPKFKAQAVYAVYAFCRTVDDISDQLKDRDQLVHFKDCWEKFLQGDVEDTPTWRALHHVFQTFEMDPTPFQDMIAGQFKDFEIREFETQEQLSSYCYDVAGTVGLMILPIIATQNHRLLHTTAIQLGEAMQITNILRDIGEDVREGRIYLPTEMLHRFKYSVKDLKDGVTDHRFLALWEELAKRAHRLYDKAIAQIKLFDVDSVLPILLSIRLYEEILWEVRKNDHDCFTKRNFVPLYKKIMIVYQTKREIKEYVKEIC